MQLCSMTGFARKQTCFECGGKKYAWTWEFKSVNGKNMDIKVRLPQWLDQLDENVKGVCAKIFCRGSFNVALEMNVEDCHPQVQIDSALLNVLTNKLKELTDAEPLLFAKPSAAELLKMNGVVKFVESQPNEEEMKTLKNELCQTAYAAASELKRDRLREGKKIGKALLTIIDRIENVVHEVEKIVSKNPQKIKEKVTRQIEDLAADKTFNEERLAQEVLLYVLRADVKEELDRLAAHIANARELLQSKEPVGRRLDFLCQEFNREANTLCSKSQDIEQTRLGMELKALIEQFREQIQNVE